MKRSVKRSVNRRVSSRVALMAGLTALVVLPTLSPATIEEQRARLPPPASPESCQNPVEGVWRSLRFYPGNMAWYSFVLEIHQSGEQLRGRIEAHSWDTAPNAPDPGACRAGLNHFVVDQVARGTVSTNLTIDFAASSWRVAEVPCGRGPWSYNLDHFRGRIDTRLQEFQSVNNDGGLQINEPTVFRRIRCFQPQERPHPYVAPPAMLPPRRRLGCNR